MTWSHHKPAPEPSLFIKLLPVLILLLFLLTAICVGYLAYLAGQSIGGSILQNMGKNNVFLTRDGARVGVTQFQNETYVDKTQRWVVMAWNLARGEIVGRSKKHRH